MPSTGLTGLITRSDTWIAEAPEEERGGDMFEERSRVVDGAASLLSAFAGDVEPEAAIFPSPDSGGWIPVCVRMDDRALLTADQ
jgi:hypothetical protein